MKTIAQFVLTASLLTALPAAAVAAEESVTRSDTQDTYRQIVMPPGSTDVRPVISGQPEVRYAKPADDLEAQVEEDLKRESL